jgi:hypothetical protein
LCWPSAAAGVLKANLVQEEGVAVRRKTKMRTVFWWGDKIGDVRLEGWGGVSEGESEGSVFVRLVVQGNVFVRLVVQGNVFVKLVVQGDVVVRLVVQGNVFVRLAV